MKDNDWRRFSDLKTRKHSVTLYDRRSFEELGVIWRMAGEWMEPTSWPRGLMSTCRKQSRKLETLVLNGWSRKVEISTMKFHEIRNSVVLEVLILRISVPNYKTSWCFTLTNLGLCSSPGTVSCITYYSKTSSVIISQLQCTHGGTPIHARVLATETVHHNSTTKEEGESTSSEREEVASWTAYSDSYMSCDNISTERLCSSFCFKTKSCHKHLCPCYSAT